MARSPQGEVEFRYTSFEGEGVVTLDRAPAEEVVHGWPVRRFGSHCGMGHYPGWWRSAKMPTHVGYESPMQQDRLMLADFDFGVTAVASQPFGLTGQDANVIRRWPPRVGLAERWDKHLRWPTGTWRLISAPRSLCCSGSRPGESLSIRRSARPPLSWTSSEATWSSTVFELKVGARIWFEGGAWTVCEVLGAEVHLRDSGDRYRLASIDELLGRARGLDADAEHGDPSLGMMNVAFPRSPSKQPSLVERCLAVLAPLLQASSVDSEALSSAAAALGVSTRTVRRRLEDLRNPGPAGLIDERSLKHTRRSVDPRWMRPATRHFAITGIGRHPHEQRSSGSAGPSSSTDRTR